MAQKIQNPGDRESSDGAENRIGACCAHSCGEADQKTFMNGAADAEQADRPDRRRNHQAQHQASVKNADFVEQEGLRIFLRLPDLPQSLMAKCRSFRNLSASSPRRGESLTRLSPASGVSCARSIMAIASLSTRSEHSPLTGMMLAAISFALLTAVDTIFKLMADGHPAYQILLVNACFASLPIVGWALITGGFGRLHTDRPLLHLVRGSVSVVSAFCAIYAYSRLPLADYYAIVFSGPLIVTALSAFWLHEHVDRARWFAVLIGFLGVVLVAHPFHNGSQHGLAAMGGRLAALLSVFCYSLSVIMIRRMRMGESNLAFAFYGYIASAHHQWHINARRRRPADVHASDIAHLALSGTLAGAASICMMTAYQRSPVALVAPFQYTQIFWGGLAGWLLWAHLPDKHLMAGAFIVAASGLFVIYREMRVPENPQAGLRSFCASCSAIKRRKAKSLFWPSDVLFELVQALDGCVDFFHHGFETISIKDTLDPARARHGGNAADNAFGGNVTADAAHRHRDDVVADLDMIGNPNPAAQNHAIANHSAAGNTNSSAQHAILADDDVMADLHLIIDLGAVADTRVEAIVPRSMLVLAPISTSSPMITVPRLAMRTSS